MLVSRVRGCGARGHLDLVERHHRYNYRCKSFIDERTGYLQ